MNTIATIATPMIIVVSVCGDSGLGVGVGEVAGVWSGGGVVEDVSVGEGDCAGDSGAASDPRLIATLCVL
jgi:hypothetical protein